MRLLLIEKLSMMLTAKSKSVFLSRYLVLIKITSFSKEDEKAIIEAADFSGKPNGNETARGYSVNFWVLLHAMPCMSISWE